MNFQSSAVTSYTEKMVQKQHLSVCTHQCGSVFVWFQQICSCDPNRKPGVYLEIQETS